jgi:Fe-S cluster biogenesis protein NfuA
MEKKIKEALDKVRPGLKADGGDVEFVSFNDKSGDLTVKLMGMCVGCPMSQMTLQEGILKEVQKHVPEVKNILQDIE